MEGNKPEKKFRAGGINATVWRNTTAKDGKEASYCTVSVGRSYKDKQGAWQNTGSLRINDLPKAALLIQEAYKYLILNGDAPEATA